MASDLHNLARDIYGSITNAGRFEQDIFNDFLLFASRTNIENALEMLLRRRHVKKCGSAVRPLYIRTHHCVRYDNIYPINGTPMLLAMHQNFTQEKPR